MHMHNKKINQFISFYFHKKSLIYLGKKKKKKE